MNYPVWWDKIVTLYHKTISIENGKKVTNWERFIFFDCFVGISKSQRINGTVLDLSSRRIVRIPIADVEPSTGDIVVIGNCDIDPKNSGSIQEIKGLENCFTASVVKINAYNGVPMPHFYISEDRG